MMVTHEKFDFPHADLSTVAERDPGKYIGVHRRTYRDFYRTVNGVRIRIKRRRTK